MRWLLLVNFLWLAIGSLAQSPVLDSLQTRLTRYKTDVLQEKVFVHTDKSFYLTGETIWLKAYVVDAATHRETDFSKVVYVELLDSKARPVMQALIDNQQSTGDGSFLLPGSLSTGMYTLRAYTAWMKNFSDDYFFQTPLQIVNTAGHPDWPALTPKETYAIQFFPEGGNLVEGLSTKLGFHLVNQYGEGVYGEGIIIKNNIDTVAHFHPANFGMGSFDFTPQKGAVYKAVIRLSSGDTISANLPTVYKEGYVLQVANAGNDAVRITVTTNKTFIEQPVYLVVHTRGAVKFAATKIIAGGKGEWLLDRKNVGDGINVITLFDADRKPVCERLYFSQPKQKLSIDLQSDAKEYASRAKVTLQIAAKNRAGDTLASHLSLSVFRLDSLQGLSQPSIDDYLWLTSELKGRVESPDYYFAKDDIETKTALDNLLLTQGWRRFAPDEVIQDSKKTFPFLPDYEGPVINGKVVSKLTGAVVPGALCYLSAPGEKFYAANAVSTTNGEVNFVAKDIYGPVELVVQAAGADSSLRVDMQTPYSLNYSAVQPLRFKLPERWKTEINNQHLNTQIAASFATPDMQRFSVPLPGDSLPFYSKADTRYVLDDYTRYPSMEEVMREITAEVQVSKQKDTFRYAVLNLPYKTHFDEGPLILFDGVPVFNTNKIIAFDPLKVKRIDVVARKYYWGNTVNNGIVSYATYDGNLGGLELDPGVELLEYNGLQVKREFYSPVYNSPEALRSREPDRREVLLWMPCITTTQGKTELIFYTSDVPGRYAVRVQGVSGNGLVGSKVIVIDVK